MFNNICNTFLSCAKLGGGWLLLFFIFFSHLFNISERWVVILFLVMGRAFLSHLSVVLGSNVILRWPLWSWINWKNRNVVDFIRKDITIGIQSLKSANSKTSNQFDTYSWFMQIIVFPKINMVQKNWKTTLFTSSYDKVGMNELKFIWRHPVFGARWVVQCGHSIHVCFDKERERRSF